MEEQDVREYVKTSARLLGLPLDDEQTARVATHLQRTAAMAELLDAFPLLDDDEVVEVFCPAPYIPSPH
ncbi:MAG: DUF4089 domain-containing protein [Hydrogenophaga sp.]|jgi:Asp-tRNA(Asn)/Glu-tRNA(Gln) amidotransferase C subunit|nr:DUF4089 domain-containing protein [Hydrogenophaga sp.]